MQKKSKIRAPPLEVPRPLPTTATTAEVGPAGGPRSARPVGLPRPARLPPRFKVAPHRSGYGLGGGSLDAASIKTPDGSVHSSSEFDPEQYTSSHRHGIQGTILQWSIDNSSRDRQLSQSETST